MRLAVLSDVHSNLPALQAVLADVDRIAPDGIWVAGDLVGYNPWPNEVLEILRERHVRAIRGNHDRAAIGGGKVRINQLAGEGGGVEGGAPGGPGGWVFLKKGRADGELCSQGRLCALTSERGW